MPITWKQAERDIAAWVPDAVRHASNGVAQADVESADLTFELKSRDIANFPKWLETAFNQARLNLKLYKAKGALVVLNVRYGRGKPQRWFLCQEVHPKTDPFTQRREELEFARDVIENQLRALDGVEEENSDAESQG